MRMKKGEGPLGKVYQGVCRGNAVAIKKIQESAVKVFFILIHSLFFSMLIDKVFFFFEKGGIFSQRD